MARKLIQPPDAAERLHLQTLQRIWKISQAIIMRGLDPLLELWPRSDQLDPFEEIVYPLPTERPREYSPFAPRPRVPRIWNLSDQELRQLWPQLNPRDVREWAPWATSYKEVKRLTGHDGSPADLQRMVASAIKEAREAPPGTRYQFKLVPSTRDPNAFQPRYPPEAVAIFDAAGTAIAAPPAPIELTTRAISRQIEWIELALGEQISERTITPVLGSSFEQLNKHSVRQLNRALAIDLPAEIPELDMLRKQWYRDHVELIESGVRAKLAEPRLRPSMLDDIAELVQKAHEEGMRVEVLAGAIKERFGVADKRAELIARDQILKVNGRLTQARQQDAGITHYFWITSNDKRVREGHKRLHKTKQSWAHPPNVGGGRHEHPGGDYQCRCTAQPVPPAWMSGG